MSIQGLNTAQSRNAHINAQQILKHAMGVEVLARHGQKMEQPLNQTDSQIFRRAKVWQQRENGAPNINPADFATNEGVTPTPATLSFDDVPVTVRHWAILFKLTVQAELMHEEDIPMHMKEQTGEVMGEVQEKVCWGVIGGGANVVYQNGTSRNAVNTPISLTRLRLANRNLQAARAQPTSSILSASAMFSTKPVESGYYCFGHTDLDADIRALPGFVPVAEYGSRKPISDYEIGSVERYRFILSPVLEPYLSQGAAVGTSGMLAADNTNIDIYPLIVMARDSWGTIPLRGHGAVSPTYIPATKKSHSNPSGLYGYVGATFFMNAVRLNENWQVRLECAATEL